MFNNGISPYFGAFLLSFCAISPRELPVCASLYTFPTMREGGGGQLMTVRMESHGEYKNSLFFIHHFLRDLINVPIS